MQCGHKPARDIVMETRNSLPSFLLLGSAGRNSGKTTLACAIIHRFARQRDIVAVKITTVRGHAGNCPRGGQGCGVCSTLSDVFQITEEFDSTAGKDTNRLLRAGAIRVFWLRVREGCLSAGIEELLKAIPPGAIVVAESNTARRVLEPGIFLMVRRAGSDSVKESAQAVMKMVDRQVLLQDDDSFNFDIEKLSILNDRWILRDASAAIMAGGKSRRMRRDKSLLTIHGKPLIHHIHDQLEPLFDEIVISTDSPNKYPFIAAREVVDEKPGLGPLMGIASILRVAKNERVFVAACDIPEIDFDFVQKLLTESRHYDCVMPMTGPERFEPLFAVYNKRVLPHIDAILLSGERKILALTQRVPTRYIQMDAMVWYRNLNTYEDYLDFSTGNVDPRDDSSEPRRRRV